MFNSQRILTRLRNEGANHMSDRQYRPIRCNESYHRMGAELNQLKYQAKHIDSLISCMNVQMEQTYCAAPLRHQSFQLDRKPRDNSRIEERLLEKAIWATWHYSLHENAPNTFARNCCEYIQSYQVPLQKSRKDDSWGKIDLVGATAQRTPCVIELKRKKSNETPLRMVVEGVAYAIALRKSWNHSDGTLYDQWINTENLRNASSEIPKVLLTVPVIGIAPSEYWDRKLGKIDAVKGDRVPADSWKQFKLLCRRFEDRGFPVSLMQFDTAENDESGLPQIRNLRKVQLPA